MHGPSPSPPPRCRRRRDNADWRIGTPSRPAARPGRRAVQSPRTSSTCIGTSQSRPRLTAAAGAFAADFQQRVAGKPGVPDRRHAGLAIGLVVMHDQQLFDRSARDGALRMILRDSPSASIHHHAVGHRRKNRAEPVLAVEPLADPGHRAIDGALPRAFGKQRLAARSTLSTARKNQNHDAFCCGAFGVGPSDRGGSRNSSSMVTPCADSRARGFFAMQHQQRHDHGAAQYEILSRWNGNHRGSSMISTGITGTARHGTMPYSASRQRVNTLAALGAAAQADRLAGAAHVRRLRLVADHLEREIGFHRRAHVEVAVVEQRPAAMRALDAAQIDGDLRLPARHRPARQDSAAAAHIRPEWWRRLRARTENGRRRAALPRARAVAASMGRSRSDLAHLDRCSLIED